MRSKIKELISNFPKEEKTKCEHEWEILADWNKIDGVSLDGDNLQFDVGMYESERCSTCGKQRHKKVGYKTVTVETLEVEETLIEKDYMVGLY